MAFKYEIELDAVMLLLPPFRMDNNGYRNLLIEASKFDLDKVLSGEAYGYLTCKAIQRTNGTMYKPFEFGHRVYLGALLTVEEMQTNEFYWRVWPKRHQFHSDASWKADTNFYAIDYPAYTTKD